MKIYSGATQYIPVNTASKVLHDGPGKVHAIILTSQNAAAPETLTLYDNTAASGTVLIKLAVTPSAPLVIHVDKLLPLVFETGLTAVTSTNAIAFIVTEF